MIYLIIVFVALVIFLAIYIHEQLKKSIELDLTDDEFAQMSVTYIFKHPCGAIIQNQNGTPRNYSLTDAKEMAKEHPYYYVKSYTDLTWAFANDYFSEPKPC